MFGITDCKIIRASLYSSVGEINQDFQFCALNAKRGGNCIIVIVDNSKCHYNVKKISLIIKCHCKEYCMLLLL